MVIKRTIRKEVTLAASNPIRTQQLKRMEKMKKLYILGGRIELPSFPV